MIDIVNTDREDKVENKIERLRRRELNDIRAVLKNPEGRRLYWRIMEHAGVFTGSYTGDTNSTMFNEGRRSVGNFLFSEMFEADPNMYSKISQEIASQRESEKRIEEIERKKSDSLV